MEMSEQIADLATALATAQKTIEGAAKDRHNPAFKSKYADLSSVWEAWQAVGPVNGLALMQLPGAMVEGKVTLTTMLTHKSGQWMRETLHIPVTKQDAQGYGSALTYARRYALSAFVGIAPEDDDGNASVKKPRDLPNNTNPANDEPAGADDVSAKWAKWATDQIEKLRINNFDREALASWDADNRKHFTKLQRAAPAQHDALMALVETLNEAFDRFDGGNVQTIISAG
jgi:hypothetical protein